jgi:hypothetical protein
MKWIAYMNGLANIFRINTGNVIANDSIGIKTASLVLGLGSGLIVQNSLTGTSTSSFEKLQAIEMHASLNGRNTKSENKMKGTSPELVKRGISKTSQYAHD